MINILKLTSNYFTNSFNEQQNREANKSDSCFYNSKLGVKIFYLISAPPFNLISVPAR